jgi:hypothetical protein
MPNPSCFVKPATVLLAVGQDRNDYLAWPVGLERRGEALADIDYDPANRIEQSRRSSRIPMDVTCAASAGGHRTGASLVLRGLLRDLPRASRRGRRTHPKHRLTPEGLDHLPPQHRGRPLRAFHGTAVRVQEDPGRVLRVLQPIGNEPHSFSANWGLKQIAATRVHMTIHNRLTISNFPMISKSPQSRTWFG